MNPNLPAIAITAALVAIHAVSTTARMLNLSRLHTSPPPEADDWFDPDDYAKSQRYNRESLWLGQIESSISLAALLTFWWLGGIAWLHEWSLSTGWPPLAAGLLFFTALWLASYLLHLPFDIFDTFALEQKFGFNKSTPALFAADQLRSLLVTGILGGAVATGVLALFNAFGSGAWIACWFLVSAFTLLMLYIGPSLLMPLFNKFTPLEDGPLRRQVMEYAEQNGFPLAGISVMDGSRRSTHANAFFTGFGNNKKVVLFDTLVSQYGNDELVAVLAHEIGHYRLRHILKRIAASILLSGAFLYLASLALDSPALYNAFGFQTHSYAAGLAAFLIASKPVTWLLSLLSDHFSRKHEFEADTFARNTTGKQEPLARALKKLSQNSLANLSPHPFYVALNHSHPPVLQRLANLKNYNTFSQ